MYCIRCGAQIEDGARFCPMCGGRQETAGSARKNASEKQDVSARKNGSAAGKSGASVNRNTTANRSSSSNRRPAENRKAAGAAGRQAPRQQTPQRKSSSGSLAVVIISIFAIAAAAAAIFFVWSRTRENREDLMETAVVSESSREDEQTAEGSNLSEEPQAAEQEENEPAQSENDGSDEEPQAAEAREPDNIQETEEEAQPETPDAAETPEAAQETPTPEPVVTASVQKASKVSLSGYSRASVSHAAATSELKQTDQPGIDNSANSAVDGDVVTSWQEDVKGYGEGEYLDFRLSKEYAIRAITFNMGNWRSEELYNDNSRPKDITIWLDRQSFAVTIPDGMTQYCVEFSGPVKASEVMIVVDSVYAGRQYDDTCISEITIYSEQ